MKPYHLIIIFLGIWTTSVAQSWSAGGQVFPFLYWYMNESDDIHINNNGSEHLIEYPNSFRPNGWSVGIPVRFISDYNWYFQTGLHWSKQELTYRRVDIVERPFLGTGPRQSYDSRIDYIHIPLIVGLRYPIHFSQSFLFVGGGINTSFLIHYKDIRVHRGDIVDGITEYKGSKTTGVHKYLTHSEVYGPVEIEPLYRRFMFGGLLEAGVNWSLTSQWALVIALQGNMDFTNVDSNSSSWTRETRGFFSLMPEDDPIRKKSTHYRLGMNVSVLYTIR